VSSPVCKIFSMVLLGLATISIAQPSAAQCGPFMGVFGGTLKVGPLAGSPFQAVEVVTQTPKPRFLSPGFIFGPERIARDSQGRIRREKFFGLYDVESMTEAEHRAARRMITICDPVKEIWIRMDTVTKTAEIRHMPALRNKDGERVQPAICGVPMIPRFLGRNGSDAKIQELGHRTIEGLDTIGYRITRQRNQLDSGATLPPWVQEQWCSEDLGAEMLHVLNGTIGPRMGPGLSPGEDGVKSERQFKLTKIRRTEPDANLFEIPLDYKRIEPVQQKPMIVGNSGRVTVRTSPPLPADH